MITPLDILFKNKGMSAEKTRIQWQEKCSDCRGITGRKVFAQCQGTGGEAFYVLYKESGTHVSCS